MILESFCCRCLGIFCFKMSVVDEKWYLKIDSISLLIHHFLENRSFDGSHFQIKPFKLKTCCKEYGVSVDPERVVVCNGGMEAALWLMRHEQGVMSRSIRDVRSSRISGNDSSCSCSCSCSSFSLLLHVVLWC